MSKERKIPSWVRHSASAVLGGSIVLASVRLQVDDIIFDAFGNAPDKNQSHPEEPLEIDESGTDSLLNLPLSEPFLNLEVLENINNNLVTVIRSTIPGYEHHVASGFQCSGFITRNNNEPVVITARHCIPQKIVSNSDGNTYNTRTEDGNSIFNVQILDSTGETYDANRWFYYDDPLNQISNDITIVRLYEQDRVSTPAIPLNVAELKKWGVYYLIRRTAEGDIQVSPIHFLDSLRKGENRFIDLNSLGASCVPGTSGSAIVNSAGEVVSVISSTDEYELTNEVVEELNLDPIHVGRVVRLCYAASSSGILDLASENFETP